jgi:hypothetical protein
MELTEMTGKLGKYVLPHSRESAVHCFKFHNFLYAFYKVLTLA